MGVNNRMSKQRLKPFKEFLPERACGPPLASHTGLSFSL